LRRSAITGTPLLITPVTRFALPEQRLSKRGANMPEQLAGLTRYSTLLSSAAAHEPPDRGHHLRGSRILFGGLRSDHAGVG
jgi:hypothetical protein